MPAVGLSNVEKADSVVLLFTAFAAVEVKGRFSQWPALPLLWWSFFSGHQSSWRKWVGPAVGLSLCYEKLFHKTF